MDSKNSVLALQALSHDEEERMEEQDAESPATPLATHSGLSLLVC